MTRFQQLLAVVVTVLMVAVVIDTIVIFRLGTTQTANQQSDTLALCDLRHDLQERVVSGKAFLKTHPRGIPGIPAATLQQSVDNAQRTLNALVPLRCSKP